MRKIGCVLYRLSAVLAITAFTAWSAQAQQLLNGPGIQVYTALGYQQMTSLASATPLPSIPAGTRMVQLCAGAVALVWRDDGVAPTASVGMPLGANQCLLYTGPISQFQVIQAATSGVLNVSYYR